MRTLGRTLVGTLAVTLLLGSGISAAATAGGAPIARVAPAPESSCRGRQIVDTVAAIRNEADGGASGQVWALIDIFERVRIWRERPGRFCVVETDIGGFRSFAGGSPGGTGTISDHHRGLTLGRQRFELDAIFHPTVGVTGFLGSFDFRCDRLGNCPGNVRFLPLYFSTLTTVAGSSTFAELDVSTKPRLEIWLQASTQSLGDITG